MRRWKLKGRVGTDAIQASVEAASVFAAAGQVHGENVAAAVSASGPAGTTTAKLTLPQVKREVDVYSSDAVALELEVKRGETSMQAAVAAALEGQIAASQLALNRLKANFAVSGPRLPGRRVTGAMAGDVRLDIAKEGVRVKLAGKIADSNLKAELTAAGFAAPVYTFAVDVDQIDLDRYATDEQHGAQDGRAARPSERGAKCSWIPSRICRRAAPCTSALLKAANVKASNVKLALKP